MQKNEEVKLKIEILFKWSHELAHLHSLFNLVLSI